MISNINYIFDFDCTITYRNFAHFWWKPDDIFKKTDPDIEPELVDNLSFKFNNDMLYDQIDINLFNNIIFGSNERIDYLDDFFSKLSTKGNLIIASRGDANKIYKCLQLNKLKKYFPRENIYGMETNKTKLITSRLNNNQNVFYIDDNHEEHQNMSNINIIHSDKYFYQYNYLNNLRYIFCHQLQKDYHGIDKKLMKKILNLSIR
jgi:hypothetical protein